VKPANEMDELLEISQSYNKMMEEQKQMENDYKAMKKA